jgi:hypothetical protein
MVLKAEQIQVARPINLLEEEQAEKAIQKERDQIKFGDALSAAFAEDNAMSWIYNGLEEFEPNPDFLLDEDTYKEFTKDIPLEYHDFLEDAVSRPHAEKLRDRVLESMKNEKILSEYGWAGVPLRLAAATIDPAAITATVLTEGVAAPFIWGSKATRLARAFRGLATGGISSGAIESYLVSQNPVKDPYDILYAAGGGMLLGGAIGGAFGKSSDQMFNNAFKKGVNDFEKAQVSDLQQATIDKGIAKPEDYKRPDGSVGAMENPLSPAKQIKEIVTGADAAIEEASDTPFSFFGKLRIDMIGQLKNSKLGISRKLAGILGEDAVEPGEFTADLIKTTKTRSYSVRYYNAYEDSYTKWAKSNNIGYLKRKFGSQRSQFGRLVADEIEFPGSSTNQAVINAAQRQRNIFREILQDAKNAGVKGFEDIPEDLRYFTHLWDSHKFTTLRQQTDDPFIPMLLSRSLRNANPELTEELADAIGRGMRDKIVDRHVGLDAGVSRIFSTSNKEFLRDLLVEEDILSESQADALVNLLHFKPEGVPSRAKKRLKFDLNYEMTFEGKRFAVKDLMNRDAEQVFNSYVNQMSGRIAFAQKGITSDADFKKQMQLIKAEGDELGTDGLKQAEKDILKFEVMYDMILGRPPKTIQNPSSDANRIARLLMDYNFIRVMNQVGFAQVAELGNAVSIDGIRGLIRVIPEFKSMLKRTANGDLEDPVARDLEAFGGIGVDRRIHQAMNRYDAHDIYVEGRGDFIDRVGLAAQPLKRITADISGMAPITAGLERAAGRIAVQSLTDLAFGIKSINFKKIGRGTKEQDIAKRMESLGLNSDMSQRVFQQIRENAVTSPSVFFKSRKIRRINLDGWDDVDARDAFVLAVSRWTRQSIQQNDVGNLNIHMTSTMGKILTQFRTFMLVSYSKQFLHNIKRNDFAAYSAMMYSSFFAGLSYTAQMHANAIGREDKEEFLRERLSPVEIGKAAFQRSSYASLFPALIDTGMPFFGEDPLFSYGRTTGLATGLISGIPSVQLIDTGYKAVQGVSRALLNDEYQVSAAQGRALKSLVPYSNAIGIKNVMNKMFEDLPESARVD